MEKKNICEYTKKELLEMENFGPIGTFTSVIIVPMKEKHDSGFRCMKFILIKQGEIVGVVSGWSDVVHINGIGGYGRFSGEYVVTPRVGWCIDCLPRSGCVRLFCDRECEAEEFIGSDFVFYVK